MAGPLEIPRVANVPLAAGRAASFQLLTALQLHCY